MSTDSGSSVASFIFVNCSCFLKLGNLLLIFIKCPTLYKNLDNKSYVQNSEVAQINSTVTFPRRKLHQKKPYKNLRLTRSVMFVIKDFWIWIRFLEQGTHSTTFLCIHNNICRHFFFYHSRVVSVFWNTYRLHFISTPTS